MTNGELAPSEDGNGQITGRPSPKGVSSRTLNFGDVYWGGALDDRAKATNKRLQYPFSSLNTFSRQDYDAWLANIECPVTGAVVSTTDQISTGALNCPKDYLTEAKKWFSVLSVGNDHTDDQESIGGFAETKTNLDTNDIQYAGHHDPKQYADLCEIVDLPARYTLNDSSFKEASLPLAICSINSKDFSPDDLAIDEIVKYSKILPTWVFGHMGDDSATEPSLLEKNTYRSYIDAGAELVIGGHNDKIQQAESYKGKLIMYSLGDFIGSSAPPGSGRALGLGVEISAKLDQSVLLWTRLSPECAKYDDSCISTAAYQGLVKPRYTYEFTTVAVNDLEGGLVGEGTEKENTAIQQLLGWDAVIAQLKY